MDKYNRKIKKGIKIIESTSKDVVIIGDNSIGKTDIIYEYLKKNETKKIYFIDAYNKVFNFKNILIDEIDEKNLPLTEDILTKRLEENTFNLKDSFSRTIIEIEQVYSFFQKELKELVKQYLELEMKLELKKNEMGITEMVLFFNDEEYKKLSNGYQAIIRLFLELIYADFYKIEEVVIDEINEFLSPRNEENIFPFLKEKFPEIRFIVTTHSAEFISKVSEGELLILDEESVEVQKLNEYRTPNDIRKIYLNLFNDEKNNDEKNAEKLIRELLNKRKLGDLTDKDLKKCKEIKKQKISPSLVRILNKLLKK